MIFAMAMCYPLKRSLCLCASMLILCLQLSLSEAQTQPDIGRRPIVKTSADESKRSAISIQLAQVAGRGDGNSRNFQRSTVSIRSRTKEPSTDYNFGQMELNLIRPEHEPSSVSSQDKLNTFYGISSTEKAAASLASSAEKEALPEDSETAEEYVANAIKMAYGTWHNNQPTSVLLVSNTEPPHRTSSSSGAEQKKKQQQQKKQKDQQQQKRLQSQQQQQEEAKQVQVQAALFEAEIQAKLQAQLAQQQALIQAEQQQQHRQQHRQQPLSSDSSTTPAAPAPVYEKEPVPRSYELYDASNQAGSVDGDIERLYRTKFYSYPVTQSTPQIYRNLEDEAEEKVRVSASTEIPKAEIMKQIEKSVIKYMKELEANGKIIASPHEQASPAPKSYYKLRSLPSDEKRYSSSTMRPKYSSPHSSGQSQLRQAGQSSQPNAQYHTQHYQESKQKPQRYQSETETAYQATDIAADTLAPNVEFIYKIKTRAPLQTATVKTVSKPYTLPLKSSSDHFDHGAALKNIEEFDLSHVVTTPDRDQEEHRVTSKPPKLYFNSDIYHDINSLPYKGEKLRGSSNGVGSGGGGVSGSNGNIHPKLGSELRHKLNLPDQMQPDYKGYSGYFVESVPNVELSEKRPHSENGASDNDDNEEDYTIPYQYVLKREPLSGKYEDERESWEQSLHLSHAKPAHSNGYKASDSGNLEYDSYSPKFNNNPEGYGYQHTYKTQLVRGAGYSNAGHSSTGKRGKRGGVTLAPATGGFGKKILRSNGGNSSLSGVSSKLVKDLEANLALRPPPEK